MEAQDMAKSEREGTATLPANNDKQKAPADSSAKPTAAEETAKPSDRKKKHAKAKCSKHVKSKKKKKSSTPSDSTSDSENADEADDSSSSSPDSSDNEAEAESSKKKRSAKKRTDSHKSKKKTRSKKTKKSVIIESSSSETEDDASGEDPKDASQREITRQLQLLALQQQQQHQQQQQQQQQQQLQLQIQQQQSGLAYQIPQSTNSGLLAYGYPSGSAAQLNSLLPYLNSLNNATQMAKGRTTRGGGYPPSGSRISGGHGSGDSTESADGDRQHGEKSRKHRGTKLDYKRVDQVWDNAIHNYKLQDTAEGATDAKYDEFLFHVRRTFDWEGKYKATLVDIKSKLLRECLQEVIGDIKGVSLVEETPKLDPNMLFL